MNQVEFTSKKQNEQEEAQYILVGDEKREEAYIGFHTQKLNVVQRVLSSDSMAFCRSRKIKRIYFVPVFGPIYEAWRKKNPSVDETEFIIKTATEKGTAQFFVESGYNTLVLYTNLLFKKTSLFPAEFDGKLTFNMMLDEHDRQEISRKIVSTLGIPGTSVYVAKQIIPIMENFREAGDRLSGQATDFLVHGFRYTWHDYDTQTISKTAYGDAWHLFGIPVSLMFTLQGNSILFSEYDEYMSLATKRIDCLSDLQTIRSLWEKIALDASPYKPCRLRTLREMWHVVDCEIPELLAFINSERADRTK